MHDAAFRTIAVYELQPERISIKIKVPITNDLQLFNRSFSLGMARDRQ